MDIRGHKLVSAPFLASPNVGSKLKGRIPDTIIIHYTAGPSADSAIKALSRADSKASAHLVVAGEGEITQMVLFDTVAWHAGLSQHNGRTGLNNYSVGIEIVNAGWLTERNGKYFAWYGGEIPADQVFHGRHREPSIPHEHWHRYTDAQVTAVRELCVALCSTYPIKFILGHDEVAPGRKHDPGPAFPIETMRELI